MPVSKNDVSTVPARRQTGKTTRKVVRRRTTVFPAAVDFAFLHLYRAPGSIFNSRTRCQREYERLQLVKCCCCTASCAQAASVEPNFAVLHHSIAPSRGQI
jgi:hypothetical protein